jgi:hypothetical protein
MDGSTPVDGLGLLPALQRLDALLARAVDAADSVFGPGRAPTRVFGPDEIVRLLRRGPGEPLLYAADLVRSEQITARGRELAWLGQTLGLTPFDLDLFKIDLAHRGQQVHRRDREEPRADLPRRERQCRRVSLTNLLWDVDVDQGRSLSLADLRARVAPGRRTTTPSPTIVVLLHDIQKGTADNLMTTSRRP